MWRNRLCNDCNGRLSLYFHNICIWWVFSSFIWCVCWFAYIVSFFLCSSSIARQCNDDKCTRNCSSTGHSNHLHCGVCFVLLFKAELFAIVSFIFAYVYIAIILSFFASTIVLCIEEYNFLDMLLYFTLVFFSHTFQLVWRQESALQIFVFVLFSSHFHSLIRSLFLYSLLSVVWITLISFFLFIYIIPSKTSPLVIWIKYD